MGLSRGRIANHLYVVQDSGGATHTIDSEQHLDRLAARLSVRSNQTPRLDNCPARSAPSGSTR
jgi:hypothetical protein